MTLLLIFKSLNTTIAICERCNYQNSQMAIVFELALTMEVSKPCPLCSNMVFTNHLDLYSRFERLKISPYCAGEQKVETLQTDPIFLNWRSLATTQEDITNYPQATTPISHKQFAIGK
jgi:hypothetical protein